MQTIYAALAAQPRVLARVEALLETDHAEPLTGIELRRLDENGESYPLHDYSIAPHYREFAVYARVAAGAGSELRWLADFDGERPYSRAAALADTLAEVLDLPRVHGMA